MAKWLRSRAAGVVALLAVALAGVEMPHASGQHHDADFDIVVVQHDASAHRVGATDADESPRPDHCVACHWGRSLRPVPDSSVLKTPSVETTVAFVPVQSFVPPTAPSAQPPLRSPPTSPVQL